MATIRFSAFSVLSGGALDLAEKPAWVVAAIPYEYYCAVLSGCELDLTEYPARVVAAIPFEHCCAFDLPANTTRYDFCTILSNAEVGDIGLFHVLVNENTGIALVGVQSAKALAVLKKATISVRYKQVAARRAIAFNDRLLSIHISLLEAASYEDTTRNIYNALHPFGDVLDIAFSQTGITTDACATAIFTLRNDEGLPSQLRIGKNMATISSSKIIEDNCRV
ncbi:hypothetical protein GGH93_002809 [Coemansia aciculifera]|nr:hypothetical protein GGH93_002809 [Coemansia aciculifera]